MYRVSRARHVKIFQGFERSGMEVRTGVRVVEVTQDQARPPWQQ